MYYYYNLPHFLFADDVIFMGTGNAKNVKAVGRLLRGFYLISGLKVSCFKSCLYGVGMVEDEDELYDLASILICKVNWKDAPSPILRVVVGANINLIKNWVTLIKSVSEKSTKLKVVLKHKDTIKMTRF